MKVAASIDRFEEGKAVLLTGKEKVVVSASWVKGFSEGDSIVILIKRDGKTTQKNKNISKKLVKEIFKSQK